MTKCHDVRGLSGAMSDTLTLMVKTASYKHLGNGWTRVCVPLEDEPALLRFFKEWRYGHKEAA